MNRRDSRELGFTLNELLVSVAIMTIIIGALYSILNNSIDVFTKNDRQIKAEQAARYSVLMIVKELRQAYELTNDASLPSDTWNASGHGLQFSYYLLSYVQGSESGGQRTYEAAGYAPWMAAAAPIIYKNGSPLPTGNYTLDYSLGTVRLTATAADSVRAAFTWDVYFKYALTTAGKLERRLYSKSGGTYTEISQPASLITVAQYIVNRSKGTPGFSKSSNTTGIRLTVDENPSLQPMEYSVYSQVTLRRK